MMNLDNPNGSIIYSENSLAHLVGLSTMECYGVVGMAKKNATEGIWELLKAQNLAKGVRIVNKDKALNIELFIIVDYGTKISVIANNIIKKVKYNVENLTGLRIASVTVNVQGVRD